MLGWLCLRGIQRNYVVSQDKIRLLIQLTDSKSVERRQDLASKCAALLKSNVLWHLDDYDVLKPRSRNALSGCIDYLSRSNLNFILKIPSLKPTLFSIFKLQFRNCIHWNRPLGSAIIKILFYYFLVSLILFCREEVHILFENIVGALLSIKF